MQDGSTPEVGQSAPDFTLPDSTGTENEGGHVGVSALREQEGEGDAPPPGWCERFLDHAEPLAVDLLGAVEEVDHREGDEHGRAPGRKAGGSHTRAGP